jgi:putative oxidoreductase
MSMTASVAPPVAANPLARFTIGLFGLFPRSLTMLVLRLTLALPFWKSGLTKWDGWFTLSFGAQALFTDEFKLHILGAEYPYLAPVLMAYASAIGESLLPGIARSGPGYAVRRAGPDGHDRSSN